MLYRLLLILTLTVFLHGCVTAKGKPFKSLEDATSETALLYLYRSDSTGYLRTPEVLINDEKTTALPNNSYFLIKLPPGKYNIKTKWVWDVSIPPIDYNIELQGGKSYFVRLWAGSRKEGFTLTGIPSYPIMPDVSFFAAAFLQTESEAMPVLSNTRAVTIHK
jgi:hypothetical protein